MQFVVQLCPTGAHGGDPETGEPQMRAGVVVVHWAIMVYGAVREAHAFDQAAVLDKSTQRFIMIVR